MPTMDEKFKHYRQSPDYPKWDDFNAYKTDSGEHIGVVPTRSAEERERTAYLAGAKADQQSVIEAQRELAALRLAIQDIDAHATPIGLADPNDPEGNPAYYAVTVGALHRALGKSGTAPKCTDAIELAALRLAVEHPHCWHCGVILEPRPRPRCEHCPDECDEPDCDAFGCRDNALLATEQKEGQNNG